MIVRTCSTKIKKLFNAWKLKKHMNHLHIEYEAIVLVDASYFPLHCSLVIVIASLAKTS